VRFEKFHERGEEICCLTHEFLDPFVTSLPNLFFFPLFLSLSYSLSSLSISTMMIVVTRTTRKIFALGGHPPDRVVDIDYVRVRSSKRRERERELKVVSRVVSSSKKIICSLSRLKMFDFFDVSNARERERGASFFEIRRKERERALTAEGRRKKKYSSY
jgi:hypothetical protein